MAGEDAGYFSGVPLLLVDTTPFWNESGNSTASDDELDPTLLTVYNVLIIAQVNKGIIVVI